MTYLFRAIFSLFAAFFLLGLFVFRMVIRPLLFVLRYAAFFTAIFFIVGIAIEWLGGSDTDSKELST